MSTPQGSGARAPYQVGDLIHDRGAGFGAYEVKQCDPLPPLLAGASRATHLVTVELPNGMPHHLYVDAAGFTTGAAFGPWPAILDGVAAGGLYDPAALDKLRAAARVDEPKPL